MNKDDRYRTHEGDDGIIWLDAKAWAQEAAKPEHQPSLQAWLLFAVVSVAFFFIGLIVSGLIGS